MDAGADFSVCGDQVTLTASELILMNGNELDLTSLLSTNNPYQFNWPFINNSPRSYTVVGTDNNSCSASMRLRLQSNTSPVDAVFIIMFVLHQFH